MAWSNATTRNCNFLIVARIYQPTLLVETNPHPCLHQTRAFFHLCRLPEFHTSFLPTSRENVHFSQDGVLQRRYSSELNGELVEGRLSSPRKIGTSDEGPNNDESVRPR